MSKPSHSKPSSKRKQERPHFYIDEQLQFKEYQKGLCRFAILKKVPYSMPDPDIIKKCFKENNHLITRNYKDFLKLHSKYPSVGIVCIDAENTSHTISVLKRLFKKHKKHAYYHNKRIRIGDNYKIL